MKLENILAKPVLSFRTDSLGSSLKSATETFVTFVNILALFFFSEMGMAFLEPAICNDYLKGLAYRCTDIGTLIECAS